VGRDLDLLPPPTEGEIAKKAKRKRVGVGTKFHYRRKKFKLWSQRFGSPAVKTREGAEDCMTQGRSKRGSIHDSMTQVPKVRRQNDVKNPLLLEQDR